MVDPVPLHWIRCIELVLGMSPILLLVLEQTTLMLLPGQPKVVVSAAQLAVASAIHPPVAVLFMLAIYG
jgi:hypothetical protein